LLAHYVTILFGLTLLHSLTNFGMLVWAFAAQAAPCMARFAPTRESCCA